MPEELPYDSSPAAASWRFPSPEFPDLIVPIATPPRVVQLSKPWVVVREKAITSVTITRLEDFPSLRLVMAAIAEYHNPLVLWQADEYTAIGNWTQAQAEKRLVAVISAINV